METNKDNILTSKPNLRLKRLVSEMHILSFWLIMYKKTENSGSYNSDVQKVHSARMKIENSEGNPNFVTDN